MASLPLLEMKHRRVGRQLLAKTGYRRCAWTGAKHTLDRRQIGNAELKAAAKPPIATERVIDTLVLARRKHAGGLTLDDLCALWR
jgi:hypothetical protein